MNCTNIKTRNRALAFFVAVLLTVTSVIWDFPISNFLEVQADSNLDLSHTTVFRFIVNDNDAGKIYHSSSDQQTTFDIGAASDGTSNYTLRPVTNTGYRFVRWYNATNNSIYTNYTTASNYSIKPPRTDGTEFVAMFVKDDSYMVTYLVDGNGTISNLWDTSDSIEGSMATAGDGYKFVGWYEGEEMVTGEANFTPTQIDSDKIYTAKFEKEARIEIKYQIVTNPSSKFSVQKYNSNGSANVSDDTTAVRTDTDYYYLGMTEQNELSDYISVYCNDSSGSWNGAYWAYWTDPDGNIFAANTARNATMSYISYEIFENQIK